MQKINNKIPFIIDLTLWILLLSATFVVCPRLWNPTETGKYFYLALAVGAAYPVAVFRFPQAWNRPGEKIKLLSNEEFFSKADYIIEIKPAGWEYITCYDAGGNYNPDEIYTTTLVIVTAIYKNDETMPISRGDTLRYFRKGGWILKEYPELGTKKIEAPLPVDYDTGEMGGASVMEDEYQAIYFMKKSDLPENPDVSKRSKHPKVCMLQDITRASIKIEGKYFSGKVHGLNGLRFDNRYELYKYMEQFEGLDVPLSLPGKMRGYLTDEVFNQYLRERNVQWRMNDRQYIDSLNRMFEMKAKKAHENTERKKKEQAQLRATQANNELTVTINNQVVQYNHNTQKYYFLFDVYANANNKLTYFDGALLRISYNTTAFGTWICDDNKVTIIGNGPAFDNAYGEYSYAWEDTSDALYISIQGGHLSGLHWRKFSEA